MNTKQLTAWLLSRISLTHEDYHNTTVRSWMKGYRKGLIDVLKYINDKDSKNPFIIEEEKE